MIILFDDYDKVTINQQQVQCEKIIPSKNGRVKLKDAGI